MFAVFFLMFLGVNLTFFPLHFAGLQGFPRKYVDYPDVYGLWNILSSYGSMLSVFSLLLFVFLIFDSLLSLRLFLFEGGTNSSPEGAFSRYVFGHSYQNEIFFSVKWAFIISFCIFNCRLKGVGLAK